MQAEHDDCAIRPALLQHLHRGDAVHFRQPDVHDDLVREELLSEVQGGFRVGSFADDDNVRLHARTLELATLEERQRLARELHDSVSQVLYGIGLGTETARTYLQRDPARAGQPIDDNPELARGGMAEMGALIFELRPESLEHEGLVAAVEKQAAAIQARHRLTIEIVANDEQDIMLEANEALYRIEREAMHNATKHARATRMDVTVRVTAGQNLLTVRDDGTGFDTGGAFAGYLGLTSMRERALRGGGKLAIESTIVSGTTIRVGVPT